MGALDTIIDNVIISGGETGHIAIGDGRFTEISAGPAPKTDGVERIDGAGALALPGLIEGHIHLTDTFIGDKWTPHRPCTDGFNVLERVAFEKENLANAAPTKHRATALLNQIVGYGSTLLRCHVDVDADAKLKNVEAISELRDQYRDVIDIQIVAFPQSGIVSTPGTPEYLDAALANGADVIGGLDPVGYDHDLKGHLDTIFGLAERHGADVDIHLHDPGTLGLMELEDIARRTSALGMKGHVVVSHAYSLGDLPEARVRQTAEALAKAGVSIMTNAPGDRPFPPVMLLREMGVNVFAGNDDVRDSWWPYGEGDMLERLMIIGYRSGFLTDEDLNHAFTLATTNAAKALRLDFQGLSVGAPADLLLVGARNIPEAIVARPRERKVFKRGRLVAEDGRFIAKV